MSWFEAVVLGIVQGLTEFLPISSTGHLRIVPAFAGWEDPGAAFTAVTQLGTMAAVLIYFRGDLLRIARAFTGTVGQARRERSIKRLPLDARLGWYIILGTIPIGIFGIVFKDQIESGARSLTLIGITLIVLGLLLLAAEKVGKKLRSIDSISSRDGLVIGLAQAAALVPGVSRSGATLTAGMFLGFDREAAARYSFLLSIPAVVLSGALEGLSLVTGDVPNRAPWGAIAIATFLAFVVGYASIAFLLRFLVRHSTGVFVAYRIVLGAAVLVLAGTGAIS